MRWNLNSVLVFKNVVETGGIIAAADQLGMPKSTVSTVVSKLESDLGVRLLERNTRNLRTTREGDAFFRQCTLIAEQANYTDALMSGFTAEPAGPLDIALPGAFCREVLAARLGAFKTTFPDIDLNLVITSRPVDVIQEQFDAAIVVGQQPDSELTQRVLLRDPLIWITSPAYYNSTNGTFGRTLAEIAGHIQVCETRYATTRVPVGIDKQRHALDLRRRFIKVNDPISVAEAVVAGAGISFLPKRYCRSYLAREQLVEILTNANFEVDAATLSVVFPTRKLMSPRLRVFLDFLDQITSET